MDVDAVVTGKAPEAVCANGLAGFDLNREKVRPQRIKEVHLVAAAFAEETEKTVPSAVEPALEEIGDDQILEALSPQGCLVLTKRFSSCSVV